MSQLHLFFVFFLKDLHSEVSHRSLSSYVFFQMPVDIGKCSRTLIRYYYDPVDDECKQFKYSGCGGNANRFMRRTNCKSRCVKKIEERTERFSSTSVKRLLKLDRIYSVGVVPGVSGCPQCDPLYGSCLNNKCGCIDGFRALGNICIDVDECRTGSVCPANSRCVNTVGSFRCECDFGFSDDGQCVIRKGQELFRTISSTNLTFRRTSPSSEPGKVKLTAIYSAKLLHNQTKKTLNQDFNHNEHNFAHPPLSMRLPLSMSSGDQPHRTHMESQCALPLKIIGLYTAQYHA
uniref:Kunitz/Bovine pancreatic trypsin inhibitor domain protein n=1 Tax=Angiostrongylus cantonensis TaxID=6313 RepID=A0A0K0CVM2_ANGCA